MPYRYLDDHSAADAAFEARGASLSACFAAACDAALGVMVEDPAALAPRETRPFTVADPELDMLLVRLLSELIYYKDAERLLLRCPAPRLERSGGSWTLSAELSGERIDPERHRLLSDVKAVTFHLLGVEQSPGGWTARVVLDI